MPRFFVEAGAITPGDDGFSRVIIRGSDADHITRSLRMHPGDGLTVCDMSRREYTCEIESVGASVTAKVIEERPSPNEPPYTAVLYQALVKGDKFDTVVQKAVECGVSVIVPVLTERCTVRPDQKGIENKLTRWRRIAAEAAGQCGRGILPEVRDMITFSEAVREGGTADCPLFCYEGDGTKPLPAVLEREVPELVSLMIGPEGGFSAAEVKAAENAGMISVGLGRRILRTETASSFVLACLSYAYEL